MTKTLELLTIDEARQCVAEVLGLPTQPSNATLNRWARIGVGGHRLRARVALGRRYVARDDLAEFLRDYQEYWATRSTGGAA